MSDIDHAVRTVVRDCMGLRAGEELLVVCNEANRELGERLRSEGAAAGGDTVLCEMAERATNGTEPPPSVGAAMAAADVVLAATAQSLSHTAARKHATEQGVRIATMPGVDGEVLARVMDVDRHQLAQRCIAVAEALSVADQARITCARGSDLTMSLTGRRAIPDAGELSEPGAWGNLPCGEGFIAPVEGTASGKLVVDGSIASFGLLEEPVTLSVDEGHLAGAEGGIGPEFIDSLTHHGEWGTNVAELGVGTNDGATLSGNVIEDEKILGTVHVAFGASAGIGGTVQVPIHLDCVVLRPTLELDGNRLVEEGTLSV